MATPPTSPKPAVGAAAGTPTGTPGSKGPLPAFDAEDQLSKLSDYIKTLGGDLGAGWKVERKVRGAGNTAGHCDIYYFSPEGKRYRSRTEIAKVLGLEVPTKASGGGKASGAAAGTSGAGASGAGQSTPGAGAAAGSPAPKRPKTAAGASGGAAKSAGGASPAGKLPFGPLSTGLAAGGAAPAAAGASGEMACRAFLPSWSAVCSMLSGHAFPSQWCTVRWAAGPSLVSGAKCVGW